MEAGFTPEQRIRVVDWVAAQTVPVAASICAASTYAWHTCADLGSTGKGPVRLRAATTDALVQQLESQWDQQALATLLEHLDERATVAAKAERIGSELGKGQRWTLLFPEGEPWEPMLGSVGVETNGFVTDSNGVCVDWLADWLADELSACR